MALELDRARLESIVRAVADRLDGEWLLVGGAAVAVWLEPRRVTEDVDLIGLKGTADERYRLMDLADELGLPIEALNSAADFFVRRIARWDQELEVLYRGTRGVVYRPTATLLVLLKLGRLSELDLADCELVVSRARSEGWKLDSSRILAALAAEPESEDVALAGRRERLRRIVAGSSP